MATITAQAADSIGGGIGVNVHSGYGTVDVDPTNAYGNVNWVALLTWLGVRHVRDNWFGAGTQGSAVAAAATKLATAGIGVLRQVNPGSITAYAAAGLPAPEAVEGYNERDLGAPSTWVNDLASTQGTIYSTVKGQWPSAKVLAPSIAQPSHIATYLSTQSNMAATADASNIHLYPRPARDTPLDAAFANSNWSAYSALVPSGPLWFTELGLCSGPPLDTAVEVEELVAARSLSTALVYLLSPQTASTIPSYPFGSGTGGFGASRVYLYELLDQHAGHYNATPTEDRYGLFHWDGTPKLTAVMLRNLISLLSDPGASFTPGSLGVTMTGQTSTGCGYTLLQRSSGTFYLLFWHPGNGIQFASGSSGVQPITGAPGTDTGYPATFAFDQSFPTMEVYRPMAGAAPVQTGSGTSIAVNAHRDVQILRLGASPRSRTASRSLRRYFDTAASSNG